MIDLLLRECRLPDGDAPVHIAIAEGRIASVGREAPAAREVIEVEGRLVTLCRRLLGWPASETGTLCRVDGNQERGDRLRRAFMLPILSPRVAAVFAAISATRG